MSPPPPGFDETAATRTEGVRERVPELSDQPGAGSHSTLLLAVPVDRAPQVERGTRGLVMVGVVLLGAALLWVALRPPPYATEALSWPVLAPPQATPMHAWRRIVLHRDPGLGGLPAGRDDCGWDAAGCHFIIDDGSPQPIGCVDATYRWRNQIDGPGVAAPEIPPEGRDGIQVYLKNTGRTAVLDPYQEQRLVELCALLIHQIPTLSVNRVMGHREAVGRDGVICPGPAVDVERIRFLVRQELQRQGWMAR
jgi:hypothetical protein